MYVFPLVRFRHHGQVYFVNIHDATPKKPQKYSLNFFPIFLSWCAKKKIMLKTMD